MLTNIFISGLGGQGVVTLANLIAQCASEHGLKVSVFNSRGMAQRGGRVTSEIRISDNKNFIYGARISSGQADILLGMEIGESINSISYLKELGTAVILDYSFIPSEMILKKEAYPSQKETSELFLKKTKNLFFVDNPVSPYNIFLLGVFVLLIPLINKELTFLTQSEVEKSILTIIKRETELSLKTFRQGYEYGAKLAESL